VPRSFLRVAAPVLLMVFLRRFPHDQRIAASSDFRERDGLAPWLGGGFRLLLRLPGRLRPWAFLRLLSGFSVA